MSTSRAPGSRKAFAYPGELESHQLYSSEPIYQLERLARWINADLEKEGVPRIHILRRVGGTQAHFQYSYFGTTAISETARSRWLKSVQDLQSIGKQSKRLSESISLPELHHEALMAYVGASERVGIPPDLTLRLFESMTVAPACRRVSTLTEAIVVEVAADGWKLKEDSQFSPQRKFLNDNDAHERFLELEVLIREPNGSNDEPHPPTSPSNVVLQFVPVFERRIGKTSYGALIGWVFCQAQAADRDLLSLVEGYLALIAERLIAISDNEMTDHPPQRIEGIGIGTADSALCTRGPQLIPCWKEVRILSESPEQPTLETGGGVARLSIPLKRHFSSDESWGSDPPKSAGVEVVLDGYWVDPGAAYRVEYAAWAAQRARRIYRQLWLDEQRQRNAAATRDATAFNIISHDVVEIEEALSRAQRTLQSVRAAVHPSWDALSSMARDIWPLFEDGGIIQLPNGAFIPSKHEPGQYVKKEDAQLAVAWIVYRLLGAEGVRSADYILHALALARGATLFQRKMLEDLEKCAGFTLSHLLGGCKDHEVRAALASIKGVLYTAFKVGIPEVDFHRRLLYAATHRLNLSGEFPERTLKLRGSFAPAHVARLVFELGTAAKSQPTPSSPEVQLDQDDEALMGLTLKGVFDSARTPHLVSALRRITEASNKTDVRDYDPDLGNMAAPLLRFLKGNWREAPSVRDTISWTNDAWSATVRQTDFVLRRER